MDANAREWVPVMPPADSARDRKRRLPVLQRTGWYHGNRGESSASRPCAGWSSSAGRHSRSSAFI